VVAVTRNECGDRCSGSPPLDQLAYPLRRHGLAGQRQRPRPAVRPSEQRRVFAVARDARRRDIGQYKLLQVVPHRDFPALAALFLEPHHVLRSVAAKVAQPPGDLARGFFGMQVEHPVQLRDSERIYHLRRNISGTQLTAELLEGSLGIWEKTVKADE
jgi:hypothetical protein